MSRPSFCLLLCGVVAVAASRPAEAVILFQDQFLVDGALEGSTPMPGPGTWTGGGGSTANPIQVVDGQAVLIQTDGGVNGRESSGEFDVQSPTATTYARFDFRLPEADNLTVAIDPDVIDEGVFFISLRGGGASELRARTGILNPISGGDFRLAINADASNLALGAIWTAAELQFDTTYRVVISYNASAAVSHLWLNPVDEMSTNITHTGTTTGTQIDRITLRQAVDYAGKQLIDNIVIATSFAEALSGGVAGVPGDYNSDNVVNAADYVVWRAAQVAGATTLDNRDPSQLGNPVGTADYEYWAARFGNTSGSGSVLAAAVPEPATWLVLNLGLAGLGARRRRFAN